MVDDSFVERAAMNEKVKLRSRWSKRGLLLGAILLGAPSALASPRRAVKVVNVHTRETIKVPAGRIPSPSVINRFFRCWRTRKYTHVDPRLVVAAVRATRKLGARKVIVLSAFRTLKANQEIGGALRSYHMNGQALDVRVVGVSTVTLCQHFRRLKLGGVGCYWNKRFVHIDVGPVRTWSRGKLSR